MVLFLTFSLAITLWAADAVSAGSADSSRTSATSWSGLIAQADALGLPTRFLRQIPADFVTLEFDDLHQFAAEYHPDDHRMVLNRALSFNAAGGALRPLARMTHGEVATFYHELNEARTDPDVEQVINGGKPHCSAGFRGRERNAAISRYRKRIR